MTIAKESQRTQARTALLQHIGTAPVCRYTGLTMTPSTIVAVYIDRGPDAPRDVATMHAKHWDSCKAQVLAHFGAKAEVLDGRHLFDQ